MYVQTPIQPASAEQSIDNLLRESDVHRILAHNAREGLQTQLVTIHHELAQLGERLTSNVNVTACPAA